MKKIVVSIIAMVLLLSTLPLSTVGEEAIVKHAEEPNSIISPDFIDPGKLSKEEAIDILKMIIDYLSLEYSDDPEIQHILSLIESELSYFTVNEEGATESISGLCAFILLLIIIRVARILGLKIAEIWTIISGYADIYTYIRYVRLTLKQCVILVILCEMYISLCTDDAGGSVSAVEMTDVLNIEGVETLIMSFDCGCTQGSPTSN